MTSSRAPESLARVPTSVAARAPSSPARIAGTAASQGRAGRGERRRYGERGDERKEDQQHGPHEAVGGELQPALGDLERSLRPPASRTERVRWALAPESEVDQRQQRQDHEGQGEDEQRPAPAQAAIAAAATRRRPGSRSRRRRRRRSARRRRRRPPDRPTARKAAAQRRAGRLGPEPGEARAGAGDDEHGEQRLELVADPVEADAEPRVGPEQREGGQRGAGDTSSA